MAMYILNVHMC